MIRRFNSVKTVAKAFKPAFVRPAVANYATAKKYANDNEYLTDALLARYKLIRSSPFLQPDVDTYNTLLSGLVRQRAYDQAKFYLNYMIEENTTPDYETFAIAIGSCLPSKNSQRAYEYVFKMAKFNLVLSKQFCEFLRKIAVASNDAKGEAVMAKLVDLSEKSAVKPEIYVPMIESVYTLKK